jgi:soluble lytic murein transglycosylase
MKKTLQLKGVAVILITGLMVLIQSLKTHNKGASVDIQTEYLRYATSDFNGELDFKPNSDIVPLPLCRNKYIDLSTDSAYPVPHWVFALPEQVDKALVLAIAKNESRFKPYAVSHRGAVGLMQIMPQTAAYIVDDAVKEGFILSSDGATGVRPKTAFDFSNPYVSLAIGARYLQYLQEKSYIGDDVVLTLAAYNAGPNVLRQWKSRYGRLASDSFAAHIPYKETRNYVRKVVNDYRKYQKLIPPINQVEWVKAEGC